MTDAPCDELAFSETFHLYIITQFAFYITYYNKVLSPGSVIFVPGLLCNRVLEVASVLEGSVSALVDDDLVTHPLSVTQRAVR